MTTQLPISLHPRHASLHRSARRLLACLALAAAAPLVHAANWTTIATAPNAWTESVDADSIVRKGDIRHAWMQISYDQPTAVARGVAPATLLKQRMAFDCAKRQTSLVTRLSYDAQGQLLDRVDTLPTVSTESFADVDPDTGLEKALDFVCAH